MNDCTSFKVLYTDAYYSHCLTSPFSTDIHSLLHMTPNFLHNMLCHRDIARSKYATSYILICAHNSCAFWKSGPISLFTSVTRFGYRQSQPFLLSILVGFLLAMITVGIGLSRFLKQTHSMPPALFLLCGSD